MTTSFINQVANLAPTIQEQLISCPQIMPNRDQLIGLKPKLDALKAWFASRGQDGNVSVLTECTVYGLLDKDNLPSGVMGWTNWATNLEAQVNMAIASNNAEGANIVNRNLVNQNFLNTPNGSNITKTLSKTANDVVSWWQTPMFTVYKYPVTPFNIAIMYGVYHYYTRREK